MRVGGSGKEVMVGIGKNQKNSKRIPNNVRKRSSLKAYEITVKRAPNTITAVVCCE
jgi:hypothetical protein